MAVVLAQSPVATVVRNGIPTVKIKIGLTGLSLGVMVNVRNGRQGLRETNIGVRTLVLAMAVNSTGPVIVRAAKA